MSTLTRLARALVAASVLVGCEAAAPTGDAPEATLAKAGIAGEAIAARLEPGAVGGTITIGFSDEPSSLNWLAGTDSASLMVAHLVTDSLVFNDADLAIVGKIAERWEWSDEGRTLTFHLRPGARWEDGVPVTSDDVLYTFESIRDPERAAAIYSGHFEGVIAVETPDPATVVVRYDEARAAALPRWNVPLLPAHRYREEADFHDNPLTRQPLSCGPFRVDSWTAGQEIVLEANADYYLGRPGVDRLVIRVVREHTTQYQALALGELDFGTLNPVMRNKAAADPSFLERHELLAFYQMFLFYLAWNGDGSVPFLADARVRRAFTQALDRQAYLEGPWYGQGIVATGTIHPASWAFHEGIEPLPFDPDGARALLEEAGYTDADGDGFRERDGEPLGLSLMFYGEAEATRRMAAWVRDSLRDVGARVELDGVPSAILFDRSGRRDYQAAMLGTRFDVDPDVYEMWHSSAIPTGGNRASYANAEVDRLLEQGRRETDTGRRRDAYRRLQEILHEDQPFSFLFYPASNIALARDIRGAAVSARGPLLHWPGAAAWWREVPGDTP